MENVKITSYADENFSQRCGEITLQVTPEKIRLKKGIKYQDDKQLGGTAGSDSFDRYDTEHLSFDTYIDCSGIIPDSEDITLEEKIAEIEKNLYAYNSEGHRPAFVEIIYGTILFKGQLTDLTTEYTLFQNDGTPLRAKVSLSFASFKKDSEAKKEAGKSSPDMSHIIVLKEGESLAWWCERIYGTSLLVDEVARLNGLNGFRHIKAGTKLLFPHLKKC